MLKALFFGTPQIYLGSACIIKGLSDQEVALFAYLMMAEGPQDRSFLAEMLWPNLSRWRAKINLCSQLRSLHRRVGRYLTVDKKNIAFNHTAPYWSDVKVFTDHISPDSHISTTIIAPEILQHLLALHTDEFLAGLNLQNAPQFDEWVSDQRRRLHNLIDKTGMSTTSLGKRSEQMLDRRSSDGLQPTSYKYCTT